MVVDCWGNIVVCILIVEYFFGIGIMVKDYGFLFNNEFIDFDVIFGGLN